MEEPKTGSYRICVFPAIGTWQNLFHERLRHGHGNFFNDPILTTMLLGFKFFEMFFWCLDHWQVSEEYDWHFRSFTSTVGRKLRQTLEEFHVHTECVGLQDDSTTVKKHLHLLEERIKPFKRHAKEICILSLGGEIRCKPCPQDRELFLEYGRETVSFIEFVLENLEVFNFKYHEIAPAKEKIAYITGKLMVFRKFANPLSHSVTRVKNLGELITQTRTWANHLSCLACLHWIDGLDESLAPTVGAMLDDFMQKTMSCTPGVVASYFDAPFPQILASNIDFFLKELVMPAMKDDIETLQEGLIFLLSFMTDPPEEDSDDRELVLGQIYSTINELPSLIWSINSNEMEDRISETKLSDFQQKVAGLEAEVRRLYAITPLSSQFNSPSTYSMGFLDSLLQNQKEWLEAEVNSITRVKRDIRTVWEELESLRPSMQRLTELQNEQEQHKDLWTQIINVVYHTSYVTRLCGVKSRIWFGLICLTSVIEEIKVIKNEVMREIKDPHLYTNKMLSVEMESRDTLLPRSTTSQVEGAFIGFTEDTTSIINHLIRGRQDLTIISISGMPGQGKTTLAKRIYNDSKIQCRFHKTVWCYIHKKCNIRDLMIHILHDVSVSEEDISKLEIQDLAEKLRKCLKGRRYLVVMDDIWDIGVWCQVQSSFPDDRIGSRIIFTSRDHNLKSQAELNFISYPLRSFSEEESWDLMKEKLFCSNGFGQEFLEIGKQIAISCKGLPLAVALVASLLGKTERKLELWNQVAENLNSHLASEGCMHIIELSYKYLPDHLKPCFLYFGAFPRGENIRAKRLKLLWMAEGFIKENDTQCSEDCLDDLVSQSLVVAVERSSMGRIKTCNVHDLVYDLCLEKIKEDNFLHLIKCTTVSNEIGSLPQKYGHHRLCIGESDPFKSGPTCKRRELPTSPVQSLLWWDECPDYVFDTVILRFMKSFKVLTVLDLEKVALLGEVFPEVILCNIHLKYLSLRGLMSNLPRSIADLWNLRTLIIRRKPYFRVGSMRIPNAMWRMKSLRHVRIDYGYLNLEDFAGNECYMVTQENLETLCGLILGDDPREVEFLGKMTRIRKLKCILSIKQLNSNWFSIFGSLEKLEELKIHSTSGGPARHVSETCSFPQNLRKLSLEQLRLASWSEMSTIGKQLPNLEVLKLLNNSCEGKMWDLEDGEFSNLRYLKLSRLDIKQINVSDCDNPFPCLEVLVLDGCWDLNEIPPEIGDIGSLNTINMRSCSDTASDSVRQISHQQRELGNDTLHVFVDKASASA